MGRMVGRDEQTSNAQDRAVLDVSYDPVVVAEARVVVRTCGAIVALAVVAAVVRWTGLARPQLVVNDAADRTAWGSNAYTREAMFALPLQNLGLLPVDVIDVDVAAPGTRRVRTRTPRRPSRSGRHVWRRCTSSWSAAVAWGRRRRR